MNTKESLLGRYQQLQSLLSMNATDNVLDLDVLSGDFVVLDNQGNELFIKFLPLKGDFVYVSNFDGDVRHAVDFKIFSEEIAEHILRCMTKGFITNEIKTHL